MRVWSVFFCLGVAAGALADGVYPYEPSLVQIKGTVRTRAYPAVRNFLDAKDKDADKEETVWLLELPAPITVRNNGQDPDSPDKPEKGVKELQLWVRDKDYTALMPFLGKMVDGKGRLFHANSPRHHTAVLLDLKGFKLVH